MHPSVRPGFPQAPGGSPQVLSFSQVGSGGLDSCPPEALAQPSQVLTGLGAFSERVYLVHSPMPGTEKVLDAVR